MKVCLVRIHQVEAESFRQAEAELERVMLDGMEALEHQYPPTEVWAVDNVNRLAKLIEERREYIGDVEDEEPDDLDLVAEGPDE